MATRQTSGRGAFQKDSEILGGAVCGHTERSCSAAVDDLQIKVSVSIRSVAGTNTHPKINFLLFLFL